MKALYTTILFALLFVQAVTAQVWPYSETFSGNAPSFVSYEGAWEMASTHPSTGSGGNYLVVSNGNITNRIIRAVVDAADYRGVTISWYERTTAGAVTRAFSYSIGNGASSTLLTTSTAVSSEWTLHAITLPATADRQSVINLEWNIGRASAGNSDKYAFDDFTVSGTFAVPENLAALPVELASFQGRALAGATKLTWATATEKNNEKFVVERSQDGKSFSKIGQVKGHGTSATARSYSFTDQAPAGGVNYYRLRQVDFDGTEAFSNVVALEITARVEANVYPTVATSAVTISLQQVTGKATISVMDASGRPVATFENTAERVVELPVEHLKSGVYFVRVADGQSQLVQRFIKN